MNKKLSKALHTYVKGIFMGTANIVPGLSGGTIALIIGIYDRLLSCISAFNLSLLSNIINSRNPSHKSDFQNSITDLDLPFLIPLSIGILTAIVLLSNLISFAFVHFRAFANSFFLGILVMSLILLYDEINLNSIFRIISTILAFSISFFLSGNVFAIQTSPDSIYIFISGVLVSLAMLLPGVSGAALLYVIGFYEFLLTTLNEFLFSLPTLLAGDYQTILKPTLILFVFGSGFFIGLINSAKFVKFALTRDRATTMSILLALMVGSFRFPISEIVTNIPSSNFSSIFLILFSFFVGAFVPYILSRMYGPST
jgi:putative membrane protein